MQIHRGEHLSSSSRLVILSGASGGSDASPHDIATCIVCLVSVNSICAYIPCRYQPLFLRAQTRFRSPGWILAANTASDKPRLRSYSRLHEHHASCITIVRSQTILSCRQPVLTIQQVLTPCSSRFPSPYLHLSPSQQPPPSRTTTKQCHPTSLLQQWASPQPPTTQANNRKLVS